jgi:hypothetical protein
MKKAPLSQKHQARRARAFERFSITAKPKGQDQADYDAYVARKEVERQALVARLAGRTPGI